jgi:DNA-directed RNA polymerase specialized sigma24 family protein
MWWRQHMRGDFLDTIYDNAFDMWQLIEDWDIAALVKSLTKKQKQVLFLSAVRLCSAVQIACYHDKTDRAVRKLLAAALGSIREKLAPLVREQIKAESPQMTSTKREFLVWYDKEKAASLDTGGNE